MEIKITPVESAIHSVTADSVKISSTVVTPDVVDIEQVFAQFLELSVGDGAASADTIRSYLSQTKMYFEWCRDNLIAPLEADKNDVKLYRQYLISEQYSVNTIANKLSIVSTFWGDNYGKSPLTMDLQSRS